MLIDWIHWLRSLPPDKLFWLLWPVLLLDAPRYALVAVYVWLSDIAASLLSWFSSFGTRDKPGDLRFEHCPSVCAIIAGLNEAASLDATLQSLWGTYPRLSIVVVDDGSSDGMAQIANVFAREHSGVSVVRKQARGGKSSALNSALPFSNAEILVCVDSDSFVGPNAIWEIVQPFQDPSVGAVSGSVMGRNPFVNWLSWAQAFEYLRCIFLGRMFTSQAGILGIVSGAFGAYRRSAVDRMLGWDVGPGEDGDLTLRLRKAGYQVVFAPYAQCFTNLLTSVRPLLKQRRRWEWAVVTFECRKHIDMANVFSSNFRMSNLMMLCDRWLFNIVLQYLFCGALIWSFVHWHEDTWKQYLLCYVAYTLLELIPLSVVLYYSNDRRRDSLIGLIAPLMPAYYLVLRLVTIFAVTEELLVRRSFRDAFVPKHVRESTWHW